MPTYCDNCSNDLSPENEFERSGFCISCAITSADVRAAARRVLAERRAKEEELSPLLTEWLYGERTNATISATRLTTGELAAFIELCEAAVQTVRTGRFTFTDKAVGSMRTSIRMMKQTLGDLRTIENVASFLAPFSAGATA